MRSLKLLSYQYQLIFLTISALVFREVYVNSFFSESLSPAAKVRRNTLKNIHKNLLIVLTDGGTVVSVVVGGGGVVVVAGS